MICKACGKDKELIIDNWHRHPHNKTGFFGSCRVCRNKQRNNRDTKETYFYEITKGDNYKEGKIKAQNKDKAIQIMKARFFGWKIEKLCTFKYKDQPIVRARKGNR